ncbi:acetoin reductase family protein [Crucibulum laeve]|uniref:Acetoin reductase family protein n=1 Tax=Crucibulum laeve TaxID=68775 RepID=A0A5C3LMG3_9AGAR|nr:acetoin reductase family protein [Crucibulum laeve]
MSTKVAIVTGAARGIGRGIALRLADDGYDLIVNDLDTTETLNLIGGVIAEVLEKGRRAMRVLGDVSEEATVASLVNTAVQQYGRLDVMVANAGVAPFKPALQTTVEEFDRTFQINVRGTFLCYKYAVQQFIEQGEGGRIIGASSAAGKEGNASLSVYSATKFAIRGLTQSFAKEYGAHKITVNAYAPGVIDTPAMRAMGEAMGSMDIFNKIMAEKTAVGYNGSTDDVASLVSFLVSKEAHFITGQTISVDGGWQLS